MHLRTVVAFAALTLLLLPAAASAKKPKIYHYSATSSADGVTTASFGSIGNITNFGGPGSYSLWLSDRSDLVGCIAVASPTAGSIGFLTISFDNANAIIDVTTFNHAANKAAMAFSVMVDCPKPPKLR